MKNYHYNNILINNNNNFNQISSEDDDYYHNHNQSLSLSSTSPIIMKPLQQEEIFEYFKSLSGAKRIELVCGLISMCIPLEIRFFDNVIQDMVNRDCHSFRDAEIKANNSQELDAVCKCDLLSEKIQPATTAATDNQSYYDDGIINSTIPMTNSTEMQNGNLTTTSLSSSSISITSTSSQSNNRDLNQMTNNNDNNNNNKNIDNGQMTNSNNAIVKSGDQSQKIGATPSLTTTIPTTNQNLSSNIASFPSRSKLIISLCLMLPNNSQCSTIVFNAIRKQLAHEMISQAVDQIFLPKNQNIHQLFSEILLLLTMAMYHPAFTYEQRDLLAGQKKDIEQLYYSIFNYIFRTQQILACQAAVAAVANQQTVPVPTQQMTVSVTGSNAAIPVPIVATSSGQQQSNYHPPATTPTNSSTGSGGNGGTNSNSQQQQLSTQSNVSSAHIAHHFHHSFHQSGATGGHKSHQHHHHHHNAGGGPTSATHLNPQVAPVAAAAQQYISFIPSTLGANITYTATGLPPPPPPISTNATNALIQNIAMLKMSSPQSNPQSSTQSQQQSSSPSPSSISPASSVSSNKLPPQSAVVQVIPQTAATTQMGQYIKLDSMYTTSNLAGGPLIPPGPSPTIVVDPNAIVPTGAMCLHNTTLIVDDKSSTTPSASCYNCGNMGHRGTECTTGTGDNSSDH